MPSYTFIVFSDLPVRVVCQSIRPGYYNDSITFTVTVGLRGRTTGVFQVFEPAPHLSRWQHFHFSSTALRRRLPGGHLDWGRLIMPG